MRMNALGKESSGAALNQSHQILEAVFENVMVLVRRTHAAGLKENMNINLPPTLDADIDNFDSEVRQFEAGTLTPAEFKHHRVIWGIYEQRQDTTYMLRTRIPGGRISPAQARTIAQLSKKHGGRIHVSTRENIQFHDLKISDIPPAMRVLKLSGIACKGGGGNTARNVIACPYAGICQKELFDVTPYVMAVTEHILSHPGSYTLPRKFKVAFSGCQADCALATVTDVGFIAKVREGKPGFTVYGGGGMGGAPRLGELLAEWIPASDCVRATEAVRRLFDRLGDRTNRARARLRFAAAKMLPGEFRALFAQELSSLSASAVPAPVFKSESIQAPNSNSSSSCSFSAPSLETLTVAPSLKVIRQRQTGLFSVLLSLPFGQVTYNELTTLADLTDQFSHERELRATPGQKLLIPSVRETDLPALAAALQTLNPGLLEGGSLDRIVACTGAATCRLGICHSQEAAKGIAVALDQATLPEDIMQHLDIRLNGCPNCCGQHPVGDIGLSGALQKKDGQPQYAYRLHLGARRGEGLTRFGDYVGTIPADALPDRITTLLQDYATHRQPNEPLSDYYDRQGKAYFLVP